jgi:hypothetical protein
VLKQKSASKLSNGAPALRHFDYLVDQEKEERCERRGLEQRAAGLLGALLLAFPLAATVARDADLDTALGIVGLSILGVGLLVALFQAGFLTQALGAPKRQRNMVRQARDEVRVALQHDRLSEATKSQTKIVTTMRDDNARMVRIVRRVTQILPLTLFGLLVGLTLVVLDGSA